MIYWKGSEFDGIDTPQGSFSFMSTTMEEQALPRMQTLITKHCRDLVSMSVD